MNGHIWATTKADTGHMHVDTQTYRQTHTDHWQRKSPSLSLMLS